MEAGKHQWVGSGLADSELYVIDILESTSEVSALSRREGMINAPQCRLLFERLT